MYSDTKNKQYMQMCIETARIFSTCGKKKYAAVLVDKNDHIVGVGYNGGPRGFQHCEDGGCPRFKEMSESGSSYDNCIAIHAEANALLHANYISSPKKIYINGPPCFSCAKLIANSTLESVYYLHSDEYSQWESIEDFLHKAGVATIRIDSASI
jgi:dCMP deaminase